MDKVTLFFVNEIEAAQILGQKELESTQEAAAAFRSMFPQAAVVLTLGSQGSVYIDKDQVIPQKCYKVKAVDTTAAGDTFTGFFVSAISKGKRPKRGTGLGIKSVCNCSVKTRGSTICTDFRWSWELGICGVSRSQFLNVQNQMFSLWIKQSYWSISVENCGFDSREILFTRIHKCLKQSHSSLISVPEIFRMPLHSQEEIRVIRLFNSLDNTVRSNRRNYQSRCGICTHWWWLLFTAIWVSPWQMEWRRVFSVIFTRWHGIL